MRRLFAALLSALLVFGFAPSPRLTWPARPPFESARFQQRAAAATTPQATPVSSAQPGLPQ